MTTTRPSEDRPLALNAGFLGLCAVTLLSTTAVCEFFLYAIILRRDGMSEERIGVVLGAYFVGSLLGMPLAGRAIRKMGTRATCVLGIVTSGLTASLLSITDGYVALTALRTLQGVAWSLILISTSVIATHFASTATLSRTIALHGACFLLGQAIGPWVADFMIPLGASWFFGSAVIIVFSALLFIPLVPRIASPPPGERTRWVDVSANLVPLLSNGLFIFGFGVSITFLADHVELLGWRGSAYGFFAGWLIGGLTVRFLAAGWLDKGARARIACLGGLGSAVGLALLWSIHAPWQLWLAGLLIGGGSSVYAPSLQAIMVTRSSSRVSAVTLFRGTSTLMLAVASMTGGLIIAHLGHSGLFLIAGLLSVLGCGALLLSGRRRA